MAGITKETTMQDVFDSAEVAFNNLKRPKNEKSSFTEGFVEGTFFKAPESAKRLMELEGLDQPYPLSDVLKKLIHGCDLLLTQKNYDGPDYEEIMQCVKRGKEIIENLKKRP